jgi:hypothetical protein
MNSKTYIKDIVTSNIENFEKVSLQGIEALSFLDRHDTKYIFPVNRIEDIFNALNENYKVLSIENKELFTYRTTYFDNKKFHFFRSHQNGKLNRYKIRWREYVDTKTAFLEVKFKSNKGKTFKKRIPYSLPNQLNGEAIEFLQKNVPVEIPKLEPKLQVSFQRITFVNYLENERVTFDINLEFTENSEGNNTILPFLGIAELKSDGRGNKSHFHAVLQNLSIPPRGISKYCMGVGLLVDGRKVNILKEKMMHLLKIEKEFTSNLEQYA